MKSVITSWPDAHSDGGAWVAQHKLRHDVFISRLNYGVEHSQSMEFDQFDTPRATYIVIMDGGQAMACCRLVPTCFKTMVGTLWPELLGGFDLRLWGYVEATRICTRREIAPERRKRALDMLIQAVLEYASSGHLKGIVGVMPCALFKAALERNGCVVDYLADPIDIDGKATVAGMIDIHESLQRRAGLKAA